MSVPTDSAAPTALEGVRVVEIASGTAVAFAAKLLAQCGAEVIRIEPPAGDEIRRSGPYRDDRPDLDGGGRHALLNAGKRSVALDVSDEAGARLASKLVASSQLLITSWKAPAALPLAHPEQMRERFPGTSYLSISDFGIDGPYASYQADSLIHEGLAGMAYVSGDPDREPLGSGVDVADYFAAATAWLAGLAALAGRMRGEQPGFIDVSIHEAFSMADDHALAVYATTGAVRRRYYSRILLMYPADIMPVKDGHIVFVPAGIDFAGPISQLLERPDLANHPLFLNASERYVRWREFDAIARPWLESHTVEEVLTRAEELHLAFGRVHDAQTLRESAHLAERGYWVELPDGSVQPGPSVKLSETPLRTELAPDLGADNIELLDGDPEQSAPPRRSEA